MEVACNMAPFAAASHANLNPILETIENAEVHEPVQNGSMDPSAQMVHETSHDLQNG